MWYTISVKGKDKIKEQLPAKTTAQELKTQNDLNSILFYQILK